VDELLSIDTARRSAETERQKLQGDRNRISKDIGIAKKNGQDTSAIEAEVRGINERIEEIGREADAADLRQRDLLLGLPNLPHVCFSTSLSILASSLSSRSITRLISA